MGRSLSQTVRSKSNQRQQQLQQKLSYQRIKDEPQSPSPDSLVVSPSPTNLVQTLVGKRELDDDDVHSQAACASPPTATVAATAQLLRPKRRATNAHIFRFLQTRNPTKLEENDLKRALEASLEECPDYWPAEDTASCSSSDQSNAPSASSNSSSTGGGSTNKTYKVPNATNTTNRRGRPRKLGNGSQSRRSSATSNMQQNHQFSSNICNCQKSNSNNNINYTNGNPPNSNCPIAYTNHCPMSNVYNRYKPVTKKNIYSESDFFHDGIMEYIDYELQKRGIIE